MDNNTGINPIPSLLALLLNCESYLIYMRMLFSLGLSTLWTGYTM